MKYILLLWIVISVASASQLHDENDYVGRLSSHNTKAHKTPNHVEARKEEEKIDSASDDSHKGVAKKMAFLHMFRGVFQRKLFWLQHLASASKKHNYNNIATTQEANSITEVIPSSPYRMNATQI